MSVNEVRAALASVTGALPAAEDRPGQRQMAEAVAKAIESGRHLVVAAGTGTGKTMGYLVPSVMAGKHVMVATATKALQDQLANKDLPFLATHLDVPFDFAILKGRSNYICLQRVRETQQAATGQLELEELAPTVKAEVKRLGEWAGTTRTGDQAELDWMPTDRAWQSVSVSSDECPGATRCPMGDACFAEAARKRAAVADVVVVNTYLYGLHVASGGVLLPEHDVVIVDEAHSLEDIMSDTVGIAIGSGRFTNLGVTLRRIIEEPGMIASVMESGVALRESIAGFVGQRLPFPLPDAVSEALITGRQSIDSAQNSLRAIDTTVEDAKQKKLRAQTQATRLIDDIDRAIAKNDGYVAFVSGGREMPRLEIAPLDVGPTLKAGIWDKHTAILTSATIPASLTERVGIPAETVDIIDVGSPFDYAANAVLYCALHMPDPRSAQYAEAVADELVALITAAGGRTLALFTSYKAMDAAATAVRERIPHKVITQRDMPKNARVKAFSDDESVCLFATSGFFQGVDIPGRTLSLVTIDRLPFPRPDDPLLSARRELLGAKAFGQIDIPRASTLLAQATGRLIRTATDRGVVAVFDPRLGKANYRWDIVKALPPMRRTRERSEVEAFLREITGDSEPDTDGG
ncbi:MAG: putative ATP-dependent helicase [Ilumatobacteraceae bacterium]|nr:putative ATP-dependent helicase [Ilumatobacteraceae bacterium]